MSRPQEAYNFITKHQPYPVCNKCIAGGLGWHDYAAQSAQISSAFAVTNDFVQESGTCSICKTRKKVIRRTSGS